MDFWIRGIGTNGANSAPLILLDGVEISSGDLNDIQPDDIQSFSILKDASATALYGVRGANGVMIVTTKEGATNEKISVKARLENSWSMPSYHLDMVDGPTYMRMYNEALKNDDPNTSPMYSEDRIQGTIKGLNRYIYPNVDWQKEIFKNDRVKKSKDKIYKTINEINDILLDIDKRNNISNIGFEDVVNNKLIKDKLDKSDSYVYNAIVNHALYNYNYYSGKNKKENFSIEDVINQVAYDNYLNDYKKIKTVKKHKKNIIKKMLVGKTYKNKILYALDRLGYEQDKAAEKFYEMFEDNEKTMS